MVRVTLKNSPIGHLEAETRALASMRFGKGDEVRYYYGSLLYKNMTWLQLMTKTHGEPFVQVTH